jgi:uncharacterized protein YjbI with pentapeptide repeats
LDEGETSDGDLDFSTGSAYAANTSSGLAVAGDEFTTAAQFIATTGTTVSEQNYDNKSMSSEVFEKNFRGKEVVNCYFRGTKFTGNINFGIAKFTNCDFTRATFKKEVLTYSTNMEDVLTTKPKNHAGLRVHVCKKLTFEPKDGHETIKFEDSTHAKDVHVGMIRDEPTTKNPANNQETLRVRFVDTYHNMPIACDVDLNDIHLISSVVLTKGEVPSKKTEGLAANTMENCKFIKATFMGQVNFGGVTFKQCSFLQAEFQKKVTFFDKVSNERERATWGVWFP